MSDNWSEKIVVGILLVLVGWLFGQGGKLLDEWRIRRKLSKQLVEELRHTLNALEMANQTFLRSLQLSVLSIVEFDPSLRFTCPIYGGYYKDVCGNLNSSQRASFDKIHSMIKEIHDLRDEQRECATAIQRGSTPDLQRWWSNMVQFQFRNLHELDFLLRHHLSSQDDPEIRLGEMSHRNYLRHSQAVQDRMVKILEDAKQIDRIVATTTYDPGMFPDLED
ncbi:MAG: hypothetical protein WBO10_03535 [Pyrinomonadaceae bacterium]